MRLTNRYWTTAGMALVLAVGAALFQRPLLLFGSAGLGAWLLVRQYLFVRAVTRLDDALVVEQTVTPERVTKDEEVHVTVTATIAEALPLVVSVVAAPPIQAIGSTTTDRTVVLSPGDRDASTTFVVTLPIAGSFTFDATTVSIHDPTGFFSETITCGSTATLAVEARTPRHVHIGEGGEEIAVAFGEHRAGRLGTGLEPAELREYVAGDAANRIDWKATARLNHPYVREYDAETDRMTALLVDHRAAMTQGADGETKLDYAREVGLAYLTSARELDDPLGLFTVGDEGLTGRNRPEASPHHYATLRHRLHTLVPTETNDQGDRRRESRTPAAARAAAHHLRDDDAAFDATLRPYFDQTVPYIQRMEADPLFSTARTVLTRLRGSLWTVFLTDDTNRAELRETVKLARRGDDHVLAFITPSVLFDPGSLADLEAAYDRYLEFEEFRRSLARLDRVAAFEVGPGDRIGMILDASRKDRQRRKTGKR